jgi:hypothetical protein
MKQTYTSKKFSNILLPVFLFILSTSSFAQKTPGIQKLYAEVGIGGTNYNGFHTSAGIHGVLKNNLVIGLSYHSINMEPNNLPKDFDPGYAIFLFIPIPNPNPDIDMSIVSIEAGKKFNGGKNIWFSTTAGLSLVNANKLSFSRTTVDPSWDILFFGEQYSNYNYTKENKSAIGATLKADFNWAFASFAGLGAGVFTNFNSIQSPVGYNLKLILGKTGRVKRNKS